MTGRFTLVRAWAGVHAGRPALVLLLVCMFFGYPTSRPGYYRWAVIMEETVTPPQWAAAATAFTLSAALYVLRPTRTTHLGRYAVQGPCRRTE
ncbi:hypothetical protein [Streptomyces sp. NPDC048603]|uniref:hypothetical protein n=1 Tax=Streptomyces sp. NPDC048603 TaxID=3365577 RepID=UPI00371C9832